MKNYNIYMNYQGKYEVVKEGWSWTAFLFVWIWALFNKLWIRGLLTGLFMSFLSLVSFTSGRIDTIIIFVFIPNIIFAIIYGIYGNRWREKVLLDRGFEHITTVEANTEDGALAKMHKEHS